MDHGPSGGPPGSGRRGRGVFCLPVAMGGRGRALLGLGLMVMALIGLAVGSSLFATETSQAYLPRTGPTMLRFTSRLSTTNLFLWPPLYPAPSQSKTEAVSIDSPPAEPPFYGPPYPLPEESTHSGETNSTSTVETSASTASDLLLVTPQMLLDYLKPAPGAPAGPVTNIGPADYVPFTPPAALPGSSATYRMQ